MSAPLPAAPRHVCCGFREGVKDTSKNEDIERCAFHEAWMKARQNAADVLGLLASDLTGGAQVFSGARWVREWRTRFVYGNTGEEFARFPVNRFG